LSRLGSNWRRISTAAGLSQVDYAGRDRFDEIHDEWALIMFVSAPGPGADDAS
jgi:hypothetical protein